MAFKDEFTAYKNLHPYAELNIDGVTTKYLLCGNKESEVTLVYLVGGGGFSDMWFRHIQRMEEDYRILTLDYPIGVNTLGKLAIFIMKLLKKLDVKKPVFIGASLGGILAQVIARKYPKRTAGVCLYSTCSLSDTSIKSLKKKYRAFGLVLLLMKIMPYKRFIKIASRGSFKSVDALEISDEEKTWMRDFFTWLYGSYTKEYDLHVTGLIINVAKLKPITKEEYKTFDDKSLLILPNSDEAFPKEAQRDLMDMMPKAKVKRLDGSHIATIYKVDDYVKETKEFLEELAKSK